MDKQRRENPLEDLRPIARDSTGRRISRKSRSFARNFLEDRGNRIGYVRRLNLLWTAHCPAGCLELPIRTARNFLRLFQLAQEWKNQKPLIEQRGYSRLMQARYMRGQFFAKIVQLHDFFFSRSL